MKIDINKIPDGFITKKQNGLILVNPAHNFFDWNEDNLIFRSSIWDEEGELVSAGFKKFFNYNEKPHIVPDPNIKDLKLYEKLDGSCLIISKYKDKLIVRTRGTFSIDIFPNCNEVYEFIKENKIEALAVDDYSLIFEWYSPSNRIILNYGDQPKFTFLNIISHKDYTYTPQQFLDLISKVYGSLNRPKIYKFESVEEIRKAKDFEGVCVYFNNDQDIKKIKTEDYLQKHRFKSSFNLEYVINMIVNEEVKINSMNHIRDNINIILDNIEFEISIDQIFQSKVIQIIQEYFKLKEEKRIFNGLKEDGFFLNKNRKDIAQWIFKHFEYPHYIFSLLDNHSLERVLECEKKILNRIK